MLEDSNNNIFISKSKQYDCKVSVESREKDEVYKSRKLFYFQHLNMLRLLAVEMSFINLKRRNEFWFSSAAMMLAISFRCILICKESSTCKSVLEVLMILHIFVLRVQTRTKTYLWRFYFFSTERKSYLWFIPERSIDRYNYPMYPNRSFF